MRGVPWFRSMRARLTAWNALTLALMLGVLGVVMHYSARAWMLASVDRELSGRARRMMAPPRGGDGPAGPGRRDRFLPDDHMGPNPPGPPPDEPIGGSGGSALYRQRLVDPSGVVLGPSGVSTPWDSSTLAAAAKGQRVFSTPTVDGEPVRVLSVPLPPNGPVRVIAQIPYPLTEVNRAISSLTLALLMLIPVALLFAVAGGLAVTGRALAPLARLNKAAGGIGAQDLAERLPVQGEDEFAQLAVTMNGMLGRLEVGFREQERLVAELRRMVEKERRFTADASHELRTPLTVIKANTTLALSGEPSAEENRQAMEDIDRAADSAARLVQDLLMLARGDAGQLGAGAITLPIGEVLERAVATAVCSDGPRPRLEAADPSLCVLGNEDELTRLFTNLIENAARYTPAEGSISVSAVQEGESVVVRVADTGVGIAPEHLPHLGERFYRVDPSRSRKDGGAGLGLSICRGIAEAHGGSIAFESGVGQGTTAIVRLPAALS